MTRHFENTRPLSWVSRFWLMWGRLTSKAEGFSLFADPPSRGDIVRARAMVDGRFLIRGQVIDFGHGAGMFWQNKRLQGAALREVHAFEWLDDLATLGNGKAQELAQALVWSWIYLYRNGAGLGWTPSLIGRRVVSSINHAAFLLNEQDETARALFCSTLAQQVGYLRWSWKKAPNVRGRIEALAGIIYGEIFLETGERFLKSALRHLGNECAKNITEEGEIPNRDCDDLLEIFTLLIWIKAAFGRRLMPFPPELDASISALAQTLRRLRQTDAHLPHFSHPPQSRRHGWLDKMLSHSLEKRQRAELFVMGFYSFKSGRTSFTIDTALPHPSPKKGGVPDDVSRVLAFQLSTAHHPIIVSTFLDAEEEAVSKTGAPASSSHSTLHIEKVDGQALSLPSHAQGDILNAHYVSHENWSTKDGDAFLGHHTMLAKRYGISHSRQIDMHFGGATVIGRDIVSAFSRSNDSSIDEYFQKTPNTGVEFVLHFNIHPDMEVSYGENGDGRDADDGVRITTPRGEVWHFRTNENAPILLEEQAYFDEKICAPATYQRIIVRGALREGAHMQILDWGLSRQSSH